MSRWPEGVLEKAVDMYVNLGKTQSEIADELGVDRAAVIRNLRKAIPEDVRKKTRHENWKKRSLQSNKTVYSDLRDKCIDMFFNTDKTLKDIAMELGTTCNTVRNAILRSGMISTEDFHMETMKRSSRVRSIKYRSKPRKEEAANGRYNTSAVPEWVTKKYVHSSMSAHSLVVCKHMGLTEIPEGYVVHHVNNDSKDNRFENLVLMSRGEHTSLHNKYLKGVTTISKESTLKWVEARRNHASDSVLEDIVYSGQEWPAARKGAGRKVTKPTE